MRYVLPFLLLLSSCAGGSIRKVDFTRSVDQGKNGVVVCALLPSQQKLLCMTPEEWNIFQENK